MKMRCRLKQAGWAVAALLSQVTQWRLRDLRSAVGCWPCVSARRVGFLRRCRGRLRLSMWSNQDDFVTLIVQFAAFRELASVKPSVVAADHASFKGAKARVSGQVLPPTRCGGTSAARLDTQGHVDVQARRGRQAHRSAS
jgi:hypothetical protein